MDLLLACTLLVEPPPRPRPRPRLLPLSPRWEGLLDVRFMKYLDANDGICFDQRIVVVEVMNDSSMRYSSPHARFVREIQIRLCFQRDAIYERTPKWLIQRKP